MQIATLVLAAIVVLAFALFTPCFTIWSLNALFGLAIPVTVKTYFSAMWLAAVVGAHLATSKKS